MGNSKLSGAGGRSKLILGTAAASTGTRKRHDSEDQSISIYKKHFLGRKTARSKKTLLEPGTSSIRQQESVMVVGFLVLDEVGFIADLREDIK